MYPSAATCTVLITLQAGTSANPNATSVECGTAASRVAVNHRSEYLDIFGQRQNNSQYGTEPTFVNAATYVDFSTSYDITKNISVYFEALNLTDQVYSTHGRFKEQILDVVDTGRMFTFGIHAKL